MFLPSKVPYPFEDFDYLHRLWLMAQPCYIYIPPI